MGKVKPKPKPKDMRARCQEIVDTMHRDAIMRQGSSVETLMAFVITEVGRTVDECLDQSAPLVLYFSDDASRAEFMHVFAQCHPNAVMKKMP